MVLVVNQLVDDGLRGLSGRTKERVEKNLPKDLL
jgi:hypothetical protein